MLGLTAGAVGVVGLGIGWGLYAAPYSDATSHRLAPGVTPLEYQHLTAVQQYWGDLAFGIGLAGSMLTALTIPFWLPAEREVPWWSWAMGGAALVLAAVGIGLVATDGQTSTSPNFATCSCYIRQDSLVLGELMIATSAPLWSVPTTHLFRLVFGPMAPAVSVSASAQQASVMVRGAW